MKNLDLLLFNKMRNNDYSHGSSCIFIKLSKTRAVKLYEELTNRNFAFTHQNWFAKEGLAPKTYKKVSFNFPNLNNNHYDEIQPGFRTMYGYITEVADTKNKRNSKFYKEISVIEEALKERNFSFDDVHEENVGRLKNGKLVLIDFDINSI